MSCPPRKSFGDDVYQAFSGVIVHWRLYDKLGLMTKDSHFFKLANVVSQIASTNQRFNFLLQGEAVLHIVLVLAMKMTILREILLGLLAYLSKPANNILILYLYQYLLPRGVQRCEVFTTVAGASGSATWAFRMATRSRCITPPLGLRKRKVTLLRAPCSPFSFFLSTILSSALMYYLCETKALVNHKGTS